MHGDTEIIGQTSDFVPHVGSAGVHRMGGEGDVQQIVVGAVVLRNDLGEGRHGPVGIFRAGCVQTAVGESVTESGA